MKSRYIYPLTQKWKAIETGNKAQSILFLQSHKLRVPVTFILLARAYDEYLVDGKPVVERLKKEIANLPDWKYAIRSSTNIEDSEKHSFAGQFQTLINIHGQANILKAILDVWESAGTNTKNEYNSKIAGSGSTLKFSVVIQEMVDSGLSGVSFSKNPVSNLNEIVIEAVEGQGEDLVQKGVTPYRWRLKNDIILEGPADFSLIHVIKNIGRDTLFLKKCFKKHVDIEWAFNGKQIYYLQIRSVTGSDKVSVYSNRMAREMLPGQIKPLVWSVNIPLVNGAWIRILSEITGDLKVKPEDLAKSFYYRAYFNMLILGDLFREFGLSADSLELMLLSDKSIKPQFRPGIKTLKHTFRIIGFLYSKLHFESIFLKEFNELERMFKFLQARVKQCNYIYEYPELFNELFIEGGKVAYLNIIIPLLMQFYNRKLNSKLAKINTSYELLDFHKDFPELEKITPACEINRIRQNFEEMPASVKSRIDSLSKLAGASEAAGILEDFGRFMERFGHLSDSGTDFSVSKWEEDPDLVFNMILQTPAKSVNKQLISFRELSFSAIKYPGLKKLYQKAGKHKVYREKISSLYIFGYGLFRTLFLGLGKEFVKHEILDAPSDIFYLSKQEVDRVVAEIGNRKIENLSVKVKQRKKDMEESKDLLLPSVIFGDVAPILEHGKIKNLKGVGTSSGTYRGRTKIIRETKDFKLVCNGDVLIIPFSDISWTPILLRAGAIVSESGGMLSHCSILAREFGIPALVSVENACALASNLDVTVDGSNGILTVHDYE